MKRQKFLSFILVTSISYYFMIGCGSSYKFARIIESERNTAISNAKVTLMDTDSKKGSYVDSTDSDGFVKIDGIDRPIVFVEIEAPGFEPYGMEHNLSTEEEGDQYKRIRLEPAKTRIVGNVYDDSTKEPLENVKISNNFNIEKVEVTDRNGRYEIILQHYFGSDEVRVKGTSSTHLSNSVEAEVNENTMNRFPPLYLKRTKALTDKELKHYEKVKSTRGVGMQTRDDPTKNPTESFLNNLKQKGRSSFSKRQLIKYLSETNSEDDTDATKLAEDELETLMMDNNIKKLPNGEYKILN